METYEKLNILYGVFILGQELMRALLLQNKSEEALEVWNKIEPVAQKIQPSSFELLRMLYDRDIIDFLLLNRIRLPDYKYLYGTIERLHKYEFVSDGYKKRLPALQEKAVDIKLNSFGTLDIYIRGNRIEDSEFKYKKWKVILAYILINAENGITKDEIITQFFANTSQKSADSKFHQLISNLRKVLTPEIKSDGYFEQNQFSFLEYANNQIQLFENFNYSFDVNKILDIHHHILNCKEPTVECTQELKSAVISFTGIFMKGIYDDWVEDLRDKLAIVYDDLYEALMKILKKQHNHEEIIHFSELKIENDPTYENAHVNSIKSELSLQNISKARRKKERFIKVLNRNEMMNTHFEKLLNNLLI